MKSARHNMQRMRTWAGRGMIVWMAAIGGLIGCPPPIPDNYQQIDSPALCYSFMKIAIENDQPKEFYYLLAHDVRAEYQYWMVQQGWSEIKNRMGIDVQRSRLLDVTYLDPSPFPPSIAARVTIEYPHRESGVVVESFLCLLEIDQRTYVENFPQWRVYYPYDPFQRRAVWFKDLKAQEPRPADPTPPQ